jgi:hypothetical protein
MRSARLGSSAISFVEYDEASKQMWITFTSGDRYTFCRVPLTVYEGLISAGSAGAFYHSNIKDRYAC